MRVPARVCLSVRLLAVAVLFTGAPAAAAAAPSVLYGPAGDGAPPAAAEAAVAAKDLLRSGDFRIEGELAALPELVDGLLLSTPPLLEPCPGQPGEPLATRVADARARIDELDFEGALALLDRGSPAAACSGPLDRTSLYDLFFLAGYARFFSDDRAGAEELFRLAAAVDPGRRWNEDLPPTAKGTFLDALQGALDSPGAALDLEGVAGLSIDGEPVSVAPALLPGVHVLELGGRRWTLRLPAAADLDTVKLIPAEPLRRALLRGERWTAPILAELARRHGWSEVVLVSDLGAVRFRDGAWVGAPLASSATAPPGPPPTRVAGVVLLGSGVAAAAVGFALHGQAWQAGQPIEENPRLEDRPTYEALDQRNRAGFAVGLAGAGVAAAGLVLTLIPPERSAAVAVGPWATGSADGVQVGLTGRFR